jgi:hypothetical protein
MHMPRPFVKKCRGALGSMIAATLVLFLIITGTFLDNQATSWIEGPRFQDLLDRETSKGLKVKASYAPLHRVGQFGLQTDSFSGTGGNKTIVALQARQITGTFNPLGTILRRWEIDSIHIESGSVMLQTTEPTPGAPKGAPWPPWWALFWPYRVHLADVKVDHANILWKLQDKESGIYDTFLEVTPNGHDFEYDAQGGQFRTPLSPPLNVLHAHILVRKPRLYCSEFLLGDDPAHPGHFLRLEGDAGLQDDRSMHLAVDLAALNISPWLPQNLRTHVVGQMNGHFDYASTGTGLETGNGSGKIAIVNGLLRDLPQIHRYATLTGSPDPGDMPLKVCQTGLSWKAGAISAENIEAECEGVVRLTGAITVAADKTLTGQVELGLTDPYLHWLPTARSAIFTREDGPYHFTTIHFSGTAQNPIQDLSPRVAKEVGKFPLLALKIIFNQAGEWFDFN